jgi:phospholipase C
MPSLRSFAWSTIVLAGIAVASASCGGGNKPAPPDTSIADAPRADSAQVDASLLDTTPPDTLAPDTFHPDAAPPPSSPVVQHLVVIVQENKSFDTYFASYCTAAPGSNPSCTDGPSCCETGPRTYPGTGEAFTVLDDAEDMNYDPDHHQSCELAEMDGGKMDKYTTAPGCGSVENFAYAMPTPDGGASPVLQYQTYATQGAIADRFFQPVAGESFSNDLYLNTGSFVFLDNSYEPLNADGVSPTNCNATWNAMTVDCTTNAAACNGATPQNTIWYLLDHHAPSPVTWGWYSEGYADLKTSHTAGPTFCPTTGSTVAGMTCPVGLNIYPCIMDAGDVTSNYFFPDKNIKDYDQSFVADLTAGTLPSVTFVKAIGWRSEHPGVGGTLSDGVTFVKGVVDAINASSYASNTLVLIMWDESGGYYDHVTPPPTSNVDDQPYGPRIPVIALGPYVRTAPTSGHAYISHVTMEHSSILKFIEWNWLGGTGLLGTRDATVNNLGSLLDSAKTGGVQVPEN